MEKLQKRKEELVEQIGEDKIKKIKKFKLLKLLETQIYELMNYWTLGQILQMINNEFKLNISKTVFYNFCSKLKKETKVININNVNDGVSQNRDAVKDKKSINNIDDLTESTLDFLSKNLPKK